MTTKASFGSLGLQALAPEAWGRQLARARTHAGYNLRQVQERLAPHISRATLARLEQRTTVPEGVKDRARAVLVLVLYGVDPSGFGLDEQDVPPGTDLRAIADLGSPANLEATINTRTAAVTSAAGAAAPHVPRGKGRALSVRAGIVDIRDRMSFTRIAAFDPPPRPGMASG